MIEMLFLCQNIYLGPCLRISGSTLGNELHHLLLIETCAFPYPFLTQSKVQEEEKRGSL